MVLESETQRCPAAGKCLMRHKPRAPQPVRTPKCVTGNGDGSCHSISTAPVAPSRTASLPHRHSIKNLLNSFGFIKPGVGTVTYGLSVDTSYFYLSNQ